MHCPPVDGSQLMARAMRTGLGTYGPMHHVVDDATYPLNIYEPPASMASQGCAERRFLDGALQLIERTR